MQKVQEGDKETKGGILDYTIEVTGWCRKHAAAVLCGKVPIPKCKPKKKGGTRQTDRRGRRPKYDIKHKAILKKVWAVLDFSSSVRTKAGMADVLGSLERCGHLELTDAIRTDMLAMSASTIDRLLKFDRKAMALRGRATTKPGTLLKNQIPARRGTDWSKDEIGFVEIGCVAHCGSSAQGEFVLTLDATDVKSTWTHPRAMLNKARKHTVKAVEHIKGELPLKLKGIDSDSGS